MYRQPRVVVLALAALCIVMVGVSAGEQNQGDRFAGIELTTVPVAGQVHMVQRPGGGGNVGVFAGPDGCCSLILCSRRWPSGWSPGYGVCRAARSAS